jgi:hypothetical protein
VFDLGWAIFEIKLSGNWRWRGENNSLEGRAGVDGGSGGLEEAEVFRAELSWCRIRMVGVILELMAFYA